MRKRRKIVILSTDKGFRYADYITKEINLLGLQAGVTILKTAGDFLRKNNFQPKETLIHARTAGPTKTYKKLKELEKRGYKLINPSETLKLTSDKFKSCEFSIKNEISCAETFSVKKDKATDFIKKKVVEWGKVIVKPRVSQGQGEYAFLFSAKNLEEINKIKETPSKELVVQEYIEYTRLSRILVIGFKAVKDAVFYDEPGNNWKCSVCLNPKIKLYENPPQKLLELAEDIAKKINSEIAFIDIFTTPKGFVLNEINSSCNLVIHERISGMNISKRIAEYLISQL